MKILYIVSPFPLLSETFILNQITGLIDRGHEVDIEASTTGDTSVIHSDVKKYSLLDRTFYRGLPQNRFVRGCSRLGSLLVASFGRPKALMNLLEVIKYTRGNDCLRTVLEAIPYLRHSSYDIIHCHFGPNGNRGRYLLDRGILKGKLVTTFHGFDLTLYLQNRNGNPYLRLFNTGHLFLPISERWKKRLIELGCDEDRILIHRMGVDCEELSFSPRRPGPHGKTDLVSIARLVEKKGLEYSIRAFAKLAKEYPKLEYTIIGDGPLKVYLQNLIQTLDVQDTIHMVGWKPQSEVHELLRKAHILITPSVTAKNGDQEGIPVVLMEAMAMGLPILSTEHSGIPELVENGISGFLVPERDADALFRRLKYLVEHPEIWHNLGLRGREHVQNYFNIRQLNDKLEKIFHQLIG